MSTIVLRSVKGSPLTSNEVDTNFTNLNNDKAATGANSDITSLSGLSTPLSLAQGGTNSISAAAAKISLNVITSATGSIVAPSGTTGERDGSPTAGYIRYNTSTATFEGYGSAWGAIGGSSSVTWAIKTTTYTAVAGDALMANTTSAPFTITLPATPAANDKVSFCDYLGTFATNKLTIGRNGLKIMGVAEDMVVSTNNISFTLTYIDTTVGWKIV